MGIFEDVTLTWDGKDYVVKSENVLPLIASIEEVVTLADLAKPSPPMAKTAQGFARALRYAGCQVSDSEVYRTFFDDGSGNKVNVVMMLLQMMVPPEKLQEKPAKGKKKPASRKKSGS